MTITFSRLGDELYWGRLGNQLWEIASTIGIATRYNQDYIFPYWKYSSYFKNPIPQGERRNYPVGTYHGLGYSDVAIFGNVDLAGYFQSWKYFKHCENLIFHYFEPAVEANEPVNEIAMHVRRGDYVWRSDFHTNLPIQYYEEALDTYFPGQTATVFSDDIEWCKRHFDNRHTFVVPNSDILDLFYMSKHKNFIIANSSYSWWGAYLSKHIDKKIIAPKMWYANGADSSDICPPDWIRI